MKLTVDSKSLGDSIAWVTKTYDQKDSQAYVALVVTPEGEGYLFHANSTSFMKSPFQVLDADLGSEEEGLKLALEGRFVQRLASTLSSQSGPSVVEYKSSGEAPTLTVKTTNGKFTIPLLASEVASEPKLHTLGEVDNREYFDSLQRLSKLCDPANAGVLPVLGTVAVKLDVEAETVVLMATDRYALGEITLPFEPAAEAAEYVEKREGKALLLPVEDATRIPPVKGVSPSTTLVYEARGGKFGYRFADEKVALFSLTDGDPVNYLKSKENSCKVVKSEVTLSTAELKKAIQTVSNLAWDETSIFLDFTEDSLVVGDSHRSNKVEVAVEGAAVEEAMSVKFIRSIINEAFSPISTERMKLRWKDDRLAFLLEPLLDDGSAQDNVFVFMVPSR